MQHQTSAREFRRRVAEAGYSDPGPERVFGGLSFSHDLVHWIGGEQDTNANLTRRLLLLLESFPIARPEVHQRVRRNVLNRYIDAERSFLSETGLRYKVPRFLLNDVVRYWRTMAVDYAAKRWERGDEGWALRNIKLRFSRMLLFASGVLICFSSCLEEPGSPETPLFKDQEEAKQRVHRRIADKLSFSPLDVVCDALGRFCKSEDSAKVLRAYDAFLDAVDCEKRNYLRELAVENSYADAVFNELRDHSHRFHDGLTAPSSILHGSLSWSSSTECSR